MGRTCVARLQSKRWVTEADKAVNFIYRSGRWVGSKRDMKKKRRGKENTVQEERRGSRTW